MSAVLLRHFRQCLQQFSRFGPCLEQALVPDDADFAAVFFEPGKIDALGGAAQIRFGVDSPQVDELISILEEVKSRAIA